MKIVVLHAAMPNFDHGLNQVLKILYDTFSELGLEVKEIGLALLGLHHYDGIEAKTVSDMMETVKEADGVIFASTAQMFAPCAAMQTFVEYLDIPAYRRALQDKCCLALTTSKTSGEREAAEYLSRIIQFAGGFDILRMPIGASYQAQIQAGDESVREMLERCAEDFYRIIRQNRKFFIARENAYETVPEPGEVSGEITAEQFKSLFGHEPRASKVTSDELVKTLNLDTFTQTQEEEIDEITKILTGKYKEEAFNRGFTGNLHKRGPKIPEPNVVPRMKTCKQRTQSLEHHYQPHLAGGVEAVYQFHVSGEETFDGYLSIENAQCAYHDGLYDAPDISVFVDAGVWTDILTGKFTAQKAFMIGQLKVRGNFVLLSKFDQIFKLGNA